ncbi:DUF2000 domain-containing protein [Curtobacterium sp. USHLN213]|uniref:DUF2000 domain-containing protein n=1 Tax=Curtobacterium sp. USHLN213 TaxID=3081255 RepID=UPI00301A96CC
MNDVHWDTKIAVVVRDDLAGWQRLNVTAFTVAGIAAAEPKIVGEPYEYADGVTTGALLQQPVFVFEATGEKLTTIAGRAHRRGVTLTVYPETIFATNNDADNRATIADLAFDQVRIAGLAVGGPAKEIDRVIKSAVVRHP